MVLLLQSNPGAAAAGAAAARQHGLRPLLPWSGRILFGLVFLQLNVFLWHLRHLPPYATNINIVPPDYPANVEEPTTAAATATAIATTSSWYLMYPPSIHPSRQEQSIIPMSRVSFTPDMTFNGECQSRKLWNATWGRSVAPWVDKMDVKVLVERMNTTVRTVPTIAVYDVHNITTFTAQTMANLPNAVMKPTQWTGHAARILNDEYYCFAIFESSRKYPGIETRRLSYSVPIPLVLCSRSKAAM
jgi:hypothetical protein